MTHHGNIGRRVVITLKDGTRVGGWDFGESPLGHYVALDRAATNIRFIPAGTSQSTSWFDDDTIDVLSPIRNFYTSRDRPELSQLDGVAREISRALDRTDFNEIRELARAFSKLRRRFRGSYDSLVLSENADQEQSAYVAETVMEVRFRYLQMTEEYERSGLLPVLVENSEVFRQSKLPFLEWMLAFDFEDRIHLEHMAFNATHREQLVPRDGGRGQLERIAPDDVIYALHDPEDQKSIQGTKSEWPKRLRVIAATGKMAVGGSLSVANVLVGVTVGIAIALPTLGLGAVAGAIGVATSAYTGLNAAWDGLKDLATAIDSA